MGNVKVRDKFFRKTITNGGDLCKQYFIVIDGDGKDSALAIRRYTLADSDRDELYVRTGDRLIKCFKGKRLWYTSFSIKIDTLNSVMDLINKL